MKEFLTVLGESENLIIISKSKFITYLKGVESEEEAKEFVQRIKKQNSLATHNCYAYIADSEGLLQKFSDDGEPQGTAGLPMLEVLKAKNLRKTAVVVTRYFGGVKLGAGGLVRAYAGSVAEAVEKAKIVQNAEGVLVEIVLNYEQYSKLNRFLEGKNVKIVDTFFDDDVKITVAVKEEVFNLFLPSFNDYYSGKGTAKVLKRGYFIF
ncbi:MAG: YigZ family protein [Clostridia bacterium]|nr:YigZ family protein [Clostridia bacterium]